MNSELKRSLMAEIQKGGQAYVRNLAAAYAATKEGCRQNILTLLDLRGDIN